MSELDEGYQLEMAEYVREEKELKAKLAVVEQKLVGPEAKLQKAREIVLKAKAAYDQINAEVTPLRSEKTLLLGELELVGEKKAKIRHEAALAKGGYGMRPGTTQLVEQMKEIAGDPEEFAMKKELAKSDAAAALAELKKKMGQE
ncbi:MAG: hypothetical protein KC635_18695 [Myxococcales bacterium]|nr:hypothetical protein [Myxococcales bacterium]MCB9735415.1 hypothetical protein [Deltaproteobacteria bacterium]